MIFRLGMTESARNESVWNGAGSVAAERARRLDAGAALARPPPRAARPRGARRRAAAARRGRRGRRRRRRRRRARRAARPRGHVVVVDAHDDDVVRVVRDRRRERAAPEAEPAHEPEPDPPGAEVALDHGDLREVALRVGDDRRAPARRARSVTIWSRTRPITRAAPPSAGSAKSPARDGCDAHGLLHPLGHLGPRDLADGPPRLSTSSGTKRSRSASRSRSAW